MECDYLITALKIFPEEIYLDSLLLRHHIYHLQSSDQRVFCTQLHHYARYTPICSHVCLSPDLCGCLQVCLARPGPVLQVVR